MELARVLRGFCEELNPFFLFEREREGYKRFVASTVYVKKYPSLENKTYTI